MVHLFGWYKARRFVFVQERVRESKTAVGRTLLDVPGYPTSQYITWTSVRLPSPTPEPHMPVSARKVHFQESAFDHALHQV